MTPFQEKSLYLSSISLFLLLHHPLLIQSIRNSVSIATISHPTTYNSFLNGYPMSILVPPNVFFTQQSNLSKCHSSIYNPWPALSNLNHLHSPQVHHPPAWLASFQFIEQLFPASCPSYHADTHYPHPADSFSSFRSQLKCCLQREIYKTRILGGQAPPFFPAIFLNQFVTAHSSIISLSSSWYAPQGKNRICFDHQ